MSLIEFKDVELHYPNQDEPTLKKLNFTIQDGEFIVVVGPSGCGKSTTLKALSGLEDITDGELYINGKLVNFTEPKDRDISMVFQNYALYPHFNVSKNISFGLSNLKIETKDGKRKLSKSEINDKLNEVAQMLEITNKLEKMPKELSGGEQQRVALARAIIREPLVYIFDEPLSNLDAKLRTKTRDDLVKMHKKLKKTFFYVTHDQVEAMTMADRIIVLRDGSIQQFDRPINIFYTPQNLFVAKFLGTPEMNILKVKYENKTIILNDNLSYPIDKVNAKIIDDRKELYFGIRPDEVNYSFEPKDGYLLLKVISREILGNQTIINIEIPGQEKLLNVVIKTKEYIESLSEIYIMIDSKIGYYFDRENELNLNVSHNK